MQLTTSTYTHKGEAYCAPIGQSWSQDASEREGLAPSSPTTAKFRIIVGSILCPTMTKFAPCLLFVALVAALTLGPTTQQAHAQDAEFSQFYSNPLLLNPAFAGTARGPRVVMSHRDQWPAISGGFVTQAVGYDQQFSSISGGLGLVVMTDQAAVNTLETTRITGMYSYQQAISRKLSLRMALEASYQQKQLDWSKLSFGDMIDPRWGFIYETQDVPRVKMCATWISVQDCSRSPTSFTPGSLDII